MGIPNRANCLEEFSQLAGKTVKSARKQKLKRFDDEGFLRLDFTDGTHCTVVGAYGTYTGGSEDEYQTRIGLAGPGREAELKDLPKDPAPAR